VKFVSSMRLDVSSVRRHVSLLRRDVSLCAKIPTLNWTKRDFRMGYSQKQVPRLGGPPENGQFPFARNDNLELSQSLPRHKNVA